MQKQWIHQELELLKQPFYHRVASLLHLTQGETILHIGCREGYLTRILAEHGAIVSGWDPNAKLIGYCQSFDLNGGIFPTYHAGVWTEEGPWIKKADSVGIEISTYESAFCFLCFKGDCVFLFVRIMKILIVENNIYYSVNGVIDFFFTIVFYAVQTPRYIAVRQCISNFVCAGAVDTFHE